MIYVFLAPGFEEIEALATVDVLRRAGEEVLTVGVTENVICGSHHIPVTTDTTIAQLPEGCPDVIVLPGGMPGTLNLEACAQLQEMIRTAEREGKILAAICAAPSIFGHMGLLKDRAATCYPGFEQELIGAKYVKQKVCHDGQIITANGAGSAIEFALEIVQAIQNKEAADRIAAAMQC